MYTYFHKMFVKFLGKKIKKENGNKWEKNEKGKI